ncbi:MAG: LysM domain-containing protein [Pseudomonadota bacterium]
MTKVTSNPPSYTPNVGSTSAGSTGSSGPAAGGTYSVKQGDTLWSLAQKVYGDGNRWRDIAEANPGVVGKDGGVKVGDSIKFPGEVKTDKVAGDPSADAKKVIDDGKPAATNPPPAGDPALKEDFNTLRNLANTGGLTTTRDNSGGWTDAKKDVSDEARSDAKFAQSKSGRKLTEAKTEVNLGSTKKSYTRDGGWKDDKKDVSDEAGGNKPRVDKDWTAHATVASVQVSGEAQVWKAEGEKKLAEGVTAKGQVQALHVGGVGSASVGVDLKKGTVKADVSGRVEAQLIGAEGSIKADTALGTTTVKGKAFVGAEATGNVTVNFDPRKGDVKLGAGVDAFAGAKASAEVNQSVKIGGHNIGSVGAKGEVYAGIGVKAKADVGFEGGKLKGSIELGAALGVGAGIKINVDVDVVGTAKAAYDVGKKAVNAVADTASNAYNGAKNFFKSLW